MSYLEEYIKEIAGAEKVDRVSFRGEKDYHMVFYSQDRVVYSQRFRKDLYYTAYLQELSTEKIVINVNMQTKGEFRI